MFRRFTCMIALVTLALATPALTGGRAAPADQEVPQQVTALDERLGADDGFAMAILITANMKGNLELCDCNFPRGGLARRVGYLVAFKNKFKEAPVLQVDAGQFWYTSSSDRIVKLQNDQVARAYSRWPVDVINLSRNDLLEAGRMLAKEGLSDRLEAYPMLKSLVSANSNYDDSVAAPVAFVIKEVSGPRISGKLKKLRIGFVGLAEPYQTSGGIADATVKNMYEAARRVVPLVRKQCDVLIIVAHAEIGGVERLASENPEADVIVAGNAEGLFKPRQAGKVLVVSAAPGNTQEGDLRIYLDKSGHVTFKYLSNDLDSGVPSDPAAEAFVQAARQERERARYSQ